MENEEIVRKITEHDEKIKVANNRIADLEELMKNQTELVVSVNKLASSMEAMASEQKEQGKRLRNLEDEPAKQWGNAKRTLFNAVLVALGSALGIGIIALLYFGTKGL